MKFDVNKLKWTREPESYSITEDQIEIVTKPHSDLWQRTYYHFRNDNAPVLQMETDEKFFSFTVKTEFESKHRFDQCGIVMYLDSDNWIKGSIEFENERFQHLGSVVTNNGYSDWATTEIAADIKSMWYRFSRRENDYCIECSEDGVVFKQMRVCHMWHGGGTIQFGVYACSPENSSFKATFTNMEMTECKWLAHDGQQPDAESGKTLEDVLKKKGYAVSCFENKEAAAEYLNGQIDQKTVGFGGSVSIRQMGLYDLLSAHNTVYWHDKKPENMSIMETRTAAVRADIYISSVNGIAETGEIINIDNTGNRVAAVSYGPKKVYLIVGKNKIAPDYESALFRARNVASPLNAQRLNRKTPCAVNGDRCYDCNSPERICRNLSVLWEKPTGAEYEVILINEDLGY